MNLTAASTINLDLKVSFVPLKATCAACGTPCVLTIPVIKQKISLDLPPCPIAAGDYSVVSLVTLPDKTPVPLITLKFSGSAELKNDAGVSLGKLDLSGSVSPK
jgi:hypothetical protein